MLFVFKQLSERFCELPSSLEVLDCLSLLYSKYFSSWGTHSKDSVFYLKKICRNIGRIKQKQRSPNEHNKQLHENRSTVGTAFYGTNHETNENNENIYRKVGVYMSSK